MSDAITMTAAEIAALPVDAGTCTKVGKHAVIAYRSSSGELKVAPNQCAHASSKFTPDIEGLVKCSMHGAKLDPKTMLYVNGPTFMSSVGNKVEAGTAQPQYTVTMNADGSATLVAPDMGKGGCSLC